MTEIWPVVGLSLRVATISIALMLIPAVAVAYGLARGHLRPAVLFESIVQMPLVLPPVATGLLLLYVFSPRWWLGAFLASLGVPVAFTWLGAVVAASVVSFPLVVQTIRAAFEQIDPAWEEAGYVYGGNRWDVFRRVTMPLAARGVAAGAVLGFARAVGEFGATITLAGNIPNRTQTIPLAIFTEISRVGGDPAALKLTAAALLLSFASIVAYNLLTRRLHGYED